MSENYREQQEEAEGIAGAGDFENEPSISRKAENRKTATMAGEHAVFEESPAPYANDHMVLKDFELSYDHADPHKNNKAGLITVIIIVALLVVVGCLAFGIWNAMNEFFQQIETEQQDTAAESILNSYQMAGLPEGVIAIVNGEEISEGEIDEYMVGFRKYVDAEDDEAWEQWQTRLGYTAKDIREAALDLFIRNIVIEQLLDEYDIEATQESIDEIYHATRDAYETEEEWQEALIDAETTEEEFLEQCRFDARTTAFIEYLGETALTDEEMDAKTLEAVKSSYPEYADAESLNDIPAERIDSAREIVINSVYSELLEAAVRNSDIEIDRSS